MINPGDINILIAEDEPDLRDLLAAKFRVFGFNVDTAESGDSAWEKVQTTEDLQILVTDVRMPGGSGFDLLTRCKERNVIFPKVFVISAFSDIPKHELYSAGAEGFMTKPFDTKILLDVIRKSLLRTEDRWRSPSSTPPKEHLTIELPELEEALDQEVIGFGRGGFFLKHTLMEELFDQLISFDIKLGSKVIEGNGIVRWLYPDPTEQSQATPEYCGIEITQLTNDSSLLVKDQLGEDPPQAYIASPKIILGKS